METTSFSDDLRRYTGLIWHWAWLIILATLLAGATAYMVSRRMMPVYQATTTILINEAPATKATDYSSIVTSERQAQTYAQLMTKQPVLQGVIERLGLDMDVAELKQAIQVQPVRDTTLVEVRVEDTHPGQAASVANTLVDEFAEQIQALQASRYAASKESLSNQLSQMDGQIKAVMESIAASGDQPEGKGERDRLEANLAEYRQTYAYLLQSFEQVRLAEAQSTSTVIQAEPAVIPDRPVRPRTMINSALAAVVGMMLALGFVFMKEALDDTLRSPEDVTRMLDLPILGLVVRHGTEEGAPVTLAQPRSMVSEAFRSLRTNIQFASVDDPMHTLLVTSPSPAEGKSTVAANLAVVLAQGGKRVVLLDADLRRPKIHVILGLPNLKGMSDLFVRELDSLDTTLIQTQMQDLQVLTSGQPPPNPAELLGSDKMSEILDLLAACAETIVIDSPPVIAVTDASVLARRVDGVLLVLRPGVTQMEAARQSVEQLRRVGANILGVVLNEVDLQKSRYHYYYYKGYYYASHGYLGSNDGNRDGRFPRIRKRSKESDKL